VLISPPNGKESQTTRLREIERPSEMDLSPDAFRKRAARARQASQRDLKAAEKRERRLQVAAARRILSEDEEDVGTPAQGRDAAGRSGAESEDGSVSGSGVHAPPW